MNKFISMPYIYLFPRMNLKVFELNHECHASRQSLLMVLVQLCWDQEQLFHNFPMVWIHVKLCYINYLSNHVTYQWPYSHLNIIQIRVVSVKSLSRTLLVYIGFSYIISYIFLTTFWNGCDFSPNRCLYTCL